MVARCAAPRCPVTVTAGSPLCPACVARLGRDLRRLPSLYQQCGERHPHSTAPAWQAPPRAGRPGPTVPLHAGATDARHAIETVLASWAGMIAQATGAAPPRRVVADLARFLLARFGLLQRHPAAGDLAAEVAVLVADAERVLRPERGRPLGGCVVPGCKGRLTGGTQPQNLQVTCDADAAHRWDGPEVLMMRDGTPAPAEAVWLDASAITALWGLSRGSVYRLASENGWRRRRRDGRTHYAADDVRSTLG
uniref:SibR n=1 Tax=Streptosporangium sibiricum TaxID=457432 RepID=C0LTN2_STRSJ|nr:SibR [Streptosporangium sibiricum]